jgi:hypothetical protein
VSELKRQLKRELLRDMKPTFTAKGVQFSDIARVMSKEEHKSSIASTTEGGRPQGELQVPASGPVEGHEEPLPSFELNTIDNLAQPSLCNLVLLVGGSFQMEVRKRLVYPCQTMLGDVQTYVSSYAVVKVDMVHENLKDLKL